jgi:hypothetical protein
MNPKKPPMALVPLWAIREVASTFAKGIKNGRKPFDWLDMPWDFETALEYRSAMWRHAEDAENATDARTCVEGFAGIITNAIILMYHEPHRIVSDDGGPEWTVGENAILTKENGSYTPGPLNVFIREKGEEIGRIRVPSDEPKQPGDHVAELLANTPIDPIGQQEAVAPGSTGSFRTGPHRDEPPHNFNSETGLYRLSVQNPPYGWCVLSNTVETEKYHFYKQSNESVCGEYQILKNDKYKQCSLYADIPLKIRNKTLVGIHTGICEKCVKIVTPDFKITIDKDAFGGPTPGDTSWHRLNGWIELANGDGLTHYYDGPSAPLCSDASDIPKGAVRTLFDDPNDAVHRCVHCDRAWSERKDRNRD